MTDGMQRHIVCATDLSEASRCALETAIELTATLDRARLHVVFVQEGAERIETIEALAEREAERERLLHLKVEAEIARVNVDRGNGLAVQTVTKVLYGKAYREILRHAAEVGADLIVVGTHGRTGLGRALLGSVAESVARHAPCNVLIAKAPDVRAQLLGALPRP